MFLLLNKFVGFLIFYILINSLNIFCNTSPANVIRLNNNYFYPIFNHTNSVFTYNYNAGYLELYNLNENGLKQQVIGGGLMLRVQDPLSLNDPYTVGPSSIGLVKQSSESDLIFNDLSHDNLILYPNQPPLYPYAAEDPRVTWVDGIGYLVFYSNIGLDNDNNLVSQLALAKCDYKNDPFDPNSWNIEGLIFSDISWSKSAALLPDFKNDNDEFYLFWGDESIYIAKTKDFINYEDTGEILLTTRDDYFDSELVESGPSPIKLGNGDYLFLYNSAQKADIPNNKNYTLQYNLGWVLLDGKDPTKIKARADEPIFSPLLDWEKCDIDSNEPYNWYGLTPNVIFINGWKQTLIKDNINNFLIYYQGCDAFMGAALLSFDTNLLEMKLI